MPNRAFVISKNDLIRWKDPRLYRPVALHDVDPWGAGMLQLHECGYLADGAEWNYEGLCNPYWRFYYNGKKGASVTVEGRTVPLLPEEVVVIPEEVAFDSHGASGVPHLWVHFSPPLTYGLPASLMRLPLDAPLAAAIAALREGLLRQDGLEETGRRRLAHLCLGLLHTWLARAPLGEHPGPPPALGLLLERIDRSLGGDLSNPALAAAVGMSVEGMIRWFKEWTGATPARYVARRRIREACRLLLLSEASIEEIAERVGFANRHHFSRVFLHYTQRSPARFRREQREG